jgi:phosphohistidine phosphatase
MDLVVVRHALAMEKSPDVEDDERPLTAEGRRQARTCAAALERLDVRLGRLLHSPKRRAFETAKLLARLVEREPSAFEPLARTPGRSLLRGLRGKRTAVVGHEPWLGELVAWLVVGSRSRGASFRLEKGGVAILRGEPKPGRMDLVSLLGPEALAAIATGDSKTAPTKG